MNFAVMIETTDGKVFTLYKDLAAAQKAAQTASCMGYAVTVFDYDVETGEYLEFYKI